MLNLRVRFDMPADALSTLDRLQRPDLAPAVDAGTDALIDVAQVYPRPPSGSRYRRTYTLRDGWAAMQPNSTGRGANGGVENDVSYAPFVVGNNDQAPIHAGRWRTEDQIADAAEARVADAVERSLTRILPRP